MADTKTLTTAQVAQLFGVSSPTVLKWRRVGRITEVRRDAAGYYLFADQEIRTLQEAASGRVD